MKSGYLIPVESPQEMQCLCLAFLIFLDHHDLSISSDEVTQGAEEILLQELDALGPVKMSALALRMAMLMQGALVLEKNGVDITELGKTMKAKQDEAALN